MTTIGDRNSARLTAFVGRSFLDEDKEVWNQVREMLEALTSLGFACEDAKEAQNRPVSDKVKEGINRNDIYIGILTRRHRICDAADQDGVLARFRRAFSIGKGLGSWATSEWVIEEIGYALGRDRRTLLLIEKGVIFPATDLDADTQWIPFARDNVKHCQTELTQMITNLIAVQLPPQSVAAPTSTPPEAAATSEEPKKEPPSFSTQVEQIITLVKRGQQEEADKLQQEIVSSEENDPDTQQLINCYILRRRAEIGDGNSLKQLKAILAKSPGDINALENLAIYHQHFGQLHDAARILLDGVEPAAKENRADLRNRAIRILLKDKKYSHAKEQIMKLIAEASEDDMRAAAFRRLADLAKELSNGDLETAALEQVLYISPADHQSRFRLAYRYSEIDRDALAAYHYKVMTDRDGDPAGLNNLGVAYRALELKGSEIDCFFEASPKNPLSKANLAHAYLERGFFKDAENLAKQVLPEQDNQAAGRARAVLDEIYTQRTKESDAIGKIDESTKEERGFRTDYAAAFCDSPLSSFHGKYSTRHGEISITTDGLHVHGSGEIEEPESGILGAFFGGLRQTGAASLKRIRKLSLEGDVTGRTAKYKLSIATRYSHEEPEKAKTTTIEGLMIIAPDRSLRLFEVTDKKVTISDATGLPKSS